MAEFRIDLRPFCATEKKGSAAPATAETTAGVITRAANVRELMCVAGTAEERARGIRYVRTEDAPILACMLGS